MQRAGIQQQLVAAVVGIFGGPSSSEGNPVPWERTAPRAR